MAKGRDRKSTRLMRLRGSNDQPKKISANCKTAKNKNPPIRSEKHDGSFEQSKEFTLGCRIPKIIEEIPLTKHHVLILPGHFRQKRESGP
jgi:hypothetical protein